MEVVLETKNLSKSYFQGKNEIRALKKINLKIEKGKIYTILGPSGAGKSTLLHLLGAIEKPSEGEIFFVGENISKLNKNQLADLRSKRIGFVFQFHHLLPEFTALENVTIPGLIGLKFNSVGLEKKHKKIEIRERALEILKELGLQNRINHKPQELSGGEQQRVAVARALINNPSLILADEPTGNLDKETGEKVYQLLLSLNKNRDVTLLVVTHNKQLASHSNQIVYFEDGQIKN